ncbi:MAG: hypothetical protein ACFHWX_03145 [Bacteroidota bacterium]
MEIYSMKMFWITILSISSLYACESRKNTKQDAPPEDSISYSFNYEQSPVDFTVSDSSGYSITFHKHLDSSYYAYFRFRLPENQRHLMAAVPILSSLWRESNQKIDIQLTSFNVGYPLEYNDILTNQIQTFAASELWLNHVRANGKNPDYRLIEMIMFSNGIYPLDELVADFDYEITGISIEKVGFVESERLIGMGFDGSLIIPMPYMVWIEIKPISQNGH